MITKESQMALDNMVSGYLNIMTPYDAKVETFGEVHMEGKTATLIVETALEGDKFNLKIIDHFDPFAPTDDELYDLGELAERVSEIHSLES